MAAIAVHNIPEGIAIALPAPTSAIHGIAWRSYSMLSACRPREACHQSIRTGAGGYEQSVLGNAVGLQLTSPTELLSS